MFSDIILNLSKIFVLLTFLSYFKYIDTEEIKSDRWSQTEINNKCICDNDSELLRKADEHIRLILRISSVRLDLILQNLAHHANVEINNLIKQKKWKIYDEIRRNFPQILTQSSVLDSVEELIFKILNQLFRSNDLAPKRIEFDMEKAVQNFFVQLIPPTFLCLSVGPCRVVSQSYANCLQQHSPSWKVFFGDSPVKMVAALKRDILKYRIIEKTIDRLHRSVIEITNVNDSCIAKYAKIVYCGQQCVVNDGDYSVGYCRESCKLVITECLGQNAIDWDSFIIILSKLSQDFNHGFEALESGIVNSLAHAIEREAPTIAKSVLQKCGRLSGAKNAFNSSFALKKPQITERKTVHLIQQMTEYIGSWKRITDDLCSESSVTNVCWDGISIIKNAQVYDQPRPVKIVKEDSFEGSAVPESWSDDEDLADGSGSGIEPQTSQIPEEKSKPPPSVIVSMPNDFIVPPAEEPIHPKKGGVDHSRSSTLTIFIVVLLRFLI